MSSSSSARTGLLSCSSGSSSCAGMACVCDSPTTPTHTHTRHEAGVHPCRLGASARAPPLHTHVCMACALVSDYRSDDGDSSDSGSDSDVEARTAATTRRSPSARSRWPSVKRARARSPSLVRRASSPCAVCGAAPPCAHKPDLRPLVGGVISPLCSAAAHAFNPAAPKP
jgi:hypothetical protein